MPDHTGAIQNHAALFDVSGQAVIATALDGKIVYWSDFATKMFGWPKPDVIGRNIMDVTTPEAGAQEASEIMEILRTGKPWSGSFNVRRFDGSECNAHVTDIPVRDGSGELIGIVGVSIPSK